MHHHLCITCTPQPLAVPSILLPQHGTYVNNRRIAPNEPVRLLPGDLIRFGLPAPARAEGGHSSTLFKVKMQHASIAEGQRHGAYDRHEHWQQQLRRLQDGAGEREVAAV